MLLISYGHCTISEELLSWGHSTMGGGQYARNNLFVLTGSAQGLMNRRAAQRGAFQVKSPPTLKKIGGPNKPHGLTV